MTIRLQRPLEPTVALAQLHCRWDSKDPASLSKQRPVDGPGGLHRIRRPMHPNPQPSGAPCNQFETGWLFVTDRGEPDQHTRRIKPYDR